ncbi:MAG: hypothetical protein U9N00_02590 [Candidatus Bipolaricaulota bacterium]|nr:hypothetical protein [Candidatus Bipolaricaulota bacterium]
MNSFQFQPGIYIKMDEFNGEEVRLAEDIREKIEEVGVCNIICPPPCPIPHKSAPSWD